MQISWSAFRSLPLFASPLSPPVVGDVPPAVDTFTPGASPSAAAAAPKRLDVDVGALLDNIRDFTTTLPESATEAKAAIGHLLEEGSRMAARNPSYVPMAIIATSARIDRARKAEDLSAALEGEHLNVPLGNFGVVSEGRLYRGAQPTHEGLAWLASNGVKTVVTLRRREVEDHYGYADFTSMQEAEACRRAGLRFVEIPVADETVPSRVDVERFLAVMADAESGPVYVHCAAGAGRTGVMCGVFERQQGVPMAQVERDLTHHYMNPKTPQGSAQLDFVRRYPMAYAVSNV